MTSWRADRRQSNELMPGAVTHTTSGPVHGVRSPASGGLEWATVLLNTLVCGCRNKRALHSEAIVHVAKADAAADHGWGAVNPVQCVCVFTHCCTQARHGRTNSRGSHTTTHTHVEASLRATDHCSDFKKDRGCYKRQRRRQLATELANQHCEQAPKAVQ